MHKVITWAGRRQSATPAVVRQAVIQDEFPAFYRWSCRCHPPQTLESFWLHDQENSAHPFLKCARLYRGSTVETVKKSDKNVSVVERSHHKTSLEAFLDMKILWSYVRARNLLFATGCRSGFFVGYSYWESFIMGCLFPVLFTSHLLCMRQCSSILFTERCLWSGDVSTSDLA